MPKPPLKTLIRLVAQDLDNQRVALLNLSEQLHRLEAQIRFLEQRVQEEAKIPLANPEFQQDFDAFRRQVQDRCVELQGSKAMLETRFEDLQEQVKDLFTQKKSYEIALERSVWQEKQTQEKETQAFLDEISGRTKGRRFSKKST